MKKVIALAALFAALAATTAAVASAPPEDENWLQMTISGDRFEIAGGQLALARAQTPAAKALGRRLIRDHTKALREEVALARLHGVGVPPSATPAQQWQLNRLKNMPRSWFDAQYASLEVKDHNQDIEETGLEAREGQLPDVRQAAKKSLPMLNKHLRMAKSLAAALDARKQA